MRRTLILLLAALALLAAGGCGHTGIREDAALAGGSMAGSEPAGGDAPESGAGSAFRTPPSGPSAAEEVRMVLVDGVLYADTGRVSDATGRCGTPDGEITSTVAAGHLPGRDGQSNFGTGYAYQLGFEAGTIEVCIGRDWVVFAPAE